MKSLKRVFIILLFISSPVFADQLKNVFVVNHGWHAGIVLKVEDVNSSDWRIDSFFKGHKYVEVGWGDEAFYKSSNPSFWMTLKAVLVPTSSILHVRALSLHDLKMISNENIAKLRVSQRAFSKLAIFIENSFTKKGLNHIIYSKGLYPNSFFYLSNKKYHILRTCNVWTAEALQKAEIDVSPLFTITTDTLFSQIRKSEIKKEISF